jgi:choline monooxygenase
VTTRERCFVDADIAKAESLPAEAFRDAAFLDRELATIFARHWLFVPQRAADELRNDKRSLAELLNRRGARVPFALLDRPLFLQRDMKGELRCFPNVCTHAWHTLVDGPARDRTILCPQHGRQFSADGRYQSQPGFKDVPNFPRECDHLRAMPAAVWDELVFAALGNAAPFDDVMAPVKETVAKLGMSAWKRAPHPTEVREVDGNWKQHAWNYMDKFHIAYIHKAPGGLADAIELAGYRTELFANAALQWSYAKDPTSGFDPDLLPARFASKGKRVFALWWLVFPNLTLNVYPWGLSVNVYAPVPGKPDRTLFHWYHFVCDEKKYARRNQAWLSESVDAEDIDAIGQVRRGVASGFAERGRFAPGEEIGPHWFHRKVYEEVFER